MHTTTIIITQSQYEMLYQKAHKEKRTISELIRQAIGHTFEVKVNHPMPTNIPSTFLAEKPDMKKKDPYAALKKSVSAKGDMEYTP